jgi:hypothetical protein
MYLPLDTTFAIFVGGLIRWLCDSRATRKGLNSAQRIRVENVGILIASGLIAGEALVGLVTAGYQFVMNGPLPGVFEHPSYLVGLIVLGLMAWSMISIPLRNAGSPDEPAPPAAMM